MCFSATSKSAAHHDDCMCALAMAVELKGKTAPMNWASIPYGDEVVDDGWTEIGILQWSRVFVTRFPRRLQENAATKKSMFSLHCWMVTADHIGSCAGGYHSSGISEARTIARGRRLKIPECSQRQISGPFLGQRTERTTNS